MLSGLADHTSRFGVSFAGDGWDAARLYERHESAFLRWSRQLGASLTLEGANDQGLLVGNLQLLLPSMLS